MTISEFISKTDSFIRPALKFIDPKISIKFYSYFRKLFLEQFVLENNFKKNIDNCNSITLWDLKFQSQIFNAAGMFKNGNGYYTVANQGAGAFLAGTVTNTKRIGNIKNGIKHPFAPYPHSLIASNWMGLPNDGSYLLAKKLSNISKIDGCPIGVSVSSNPDESGLIALKGVIECLNNFSKANVDFIELNESCPNVVHDHQIDSSGLDQNLISRIEYINTFFIKKNPNIPIIVKLSNDIDINLLPNLLSLLISSGFSGVNFGNTTTNYELINNFIHTDDWKIYKYFISNFGGGISGLALKKQSLNLSKEANLILKNYNLNKEFHIIRTGGIFDYKDLIQSSKVGVALNQWYTGYFEYFSKFGHSVYEELLKGKG